MKIPLNFPNKIYPLVKTKRTFIFLHANLKLLGLGQFVDIIVWYFYNLLNGIYTLKTGIRIRVRIRILGQIRIRDSNPRKNESLTSLRRYRGATHQGIETGIFFVTLHLISATVNYNPLWRR